MMHETLGIVWFTLLVVLWTGFVILESLTSGVGMIFQSANNESEGKVLQYTVGPYWDGSEVWFITAGGATFAAFPLVYAEMFSNLYVALFLLVLMLITRGVSMELVYKDDSRIWQNAMSRAYTLSSYGVALLLGVRFTNLFLKANTLTESTNSFFDLLSKMGILGGLLFISYYRTSGILWSNIKANNDVVTRLRKQLLPSSIAAALIVPILMMGFNWDTNLFTTNYVELPVLFLIPGLAMLCPIFALFFILKKWYVAAFIANTLAILFFMLVGYTGIFPYMVPGVTLTDGMASELTLTIMTAVAAVFVPIVLIYQGWKFYRFRSKITHLYFE